MTQFNHKTVLVTGAGGGIGSATAQRFAQMGATVIVADIINTAAEKTAQAINLQGGKAEVVAFDLTSKDACQQAIEKIEKCYQHIDILVNNAGVMRRGELLHLSEKDWLLSLDVNLNALFYLCQAALPKMIASGGGSIVNTASQWGVTPASGHIAYNVSKAAVVAFTKSLARDYAPQKIRVNAVCPGEIHTPMLEKGIAEKGKTIRDLEKLIPFGRIGRPEEVAALITFLASSDAEFICGACVEITGAQAVT